MKVGKAVLTLMVLAVLLAGCIEDPTVTPTVSPLPTVSPVAVPAAPCPDVSAAAVQAPSQDSLTAELIAAIVAAVISVFLEVVPGLAAKWDKIDSTYKQLIWLGGCLAVPLLVLGAGCLGLDLGVIAPACDKHGAVKAFRIGFAAYFTGQMAFAAVHTIRARLHKR